MSLIRISADNPAALLAAAVLLFVLGVMGIASLPIQMLPNLEYPEVNINTSREEWRERVRRPRLQIADADAIRDQLTIPARVAVESAAEWQKIYSNGRAPLWHAPRGGPSRMQRAWPRPAPPPTRSAR